MNIIKFINGENKFEFEKPVYQEAPVDQEVQQKTEQIEGYADSMYDIDFESSDLLREFNSVLGTMDMDKDEALQYQNDVLTWLEDEMLDNEEYELLQDTVKYLHEELDRQIEEARFVQTVRGTKEIDDQFRDNIKAKCWDKNTGKLDFSGPKSDVERVVSLNHLFNEPTIKIQINTKRKSAEARKIPENAEMEGDYYVLVKEGDNYVYQTSDGETQKAYVYHGDIVSTDVGGAEIAQATSEEIETHVLSSEAREIMKEYKKSQLDLGTTELFTSDINIGGTNYTFMPTDLNGFQYSDPGGKFPEAVRARLQEHNLSENISGINPAMNLKLTLEQDPGMRQLGNWLIGEFGQYKEQLYAMGVRNNIDAFSPDEAIKFIQLIMTENFGDRISGDYKRLIPADDLSILELSMNPNIPVVCRNSVQIFEGYMRALQNIQSRSSGTNYLESVYVKSTAASAFEGAGGVPGLQKGHAWNEVYIREADSNQISVMHLDPNWGVQEGKKFDYTADRITFTLQQLADNPQQVMDQTAEAMNRFTEMLESGEIQITSQSMITLWNRLRSLYFVGPGVDSQEIREAAWKLRTVLKKSGQEKWANRMGEFGILQACFEFSYAQTSPLSNPQSREGVLNLIDYGTEVLYKLYGAMMDPNYRDYYTAEYGMQFKDVKMHISNLWGQIKSAGADKLQQYPAFNTIVARLGNLDFLKEDVNAVVASLETTAGEETEKA